MKICKITVIFLLVGLILLVAFTAIDIRTGIKINGDKVYTEKNANIFTKLYSTYIGLKISEPRIAGCDKTEIDTQTLSPLKTLYREDQEIRHHDIIPDALETHAQKSTEFIKQYFNSGVLNEICQLGAEGIYYLIALATHSRDTDFQIRLYEAIPKSRLKGLVFQSTLAIWQDKIAINRGEKQIFGTQSYCHAALKRHVVVDVLEPEKLDQRRAKVGLPPVGFGLRMLDPDGMDCADAKHTDAHS